MESQVNSRLARMKGKCLKNISQRLLREYVQRSNFWILGSTGNEWLLAPASVPPWRKSREMSSSSSTFHKEEIPRERWMKCHPGDRSLDQHWNARDNYQFSFPRLRVVPQGHAEGFTWQLLKTWPQHQRPVFLKSFPLNHLPEETFANAMMELKA